MQNLAALLASSAPGPSFTCITAPPSPGSPAPLLRPYLEPARPQERRR